MTGFKEAEDLLDQAVKDLPETLPIQEVIDGIKLLLRELEAKLSKRPMVLIGVNDERTIKALRCAVEEYVGNWYIREAGGPARIRDTGPVGQLIERLEVACENAKLGIPLAAPAFTQQDISNLHEARAIILHELPMQGPRIAETLNKLLGERR